MKELFIRTLTGIGLILVVIGCILLGPESFGIVLLLVYVLGLRELFALLQRRDLVTRWFRSVPGIILLVSTYVVFSFDLSPLWFLLPPLLWFVTALRGGVTLAGTLAFVWLAIPFSSFYALGWMEGPGYQPRLPLAIIALVWINDTFAYLAGSLFGKHRMTPLLSPGKTWEGFAGGLMFSLLAGWFIWHLTQLSSLWVWFSISLLVSILGLAGDLFESGLKRTVKVKNTGSLLPGHGGILDRFDSLLFVAPVILLLVVLLKLIK